MRGHVHPRGNRLAVVFDDVSPDLEDAIAAVMLVAIEETRTPRVLIVETDVARRAALAASLRAAGCEPVEAETPLDAIIAAEARSVPPTGALIACVLTQTDGRELVAHLTREQPSMRASVLDSTTATDARSLRAAVAPQTVLIVDDDPDWRELLSEVLINAGFKTESAVDGEDGLSRIREHPGRYAVIVLDLEMPRLDGRGFRKAQQADPAMASIPVVLATGALPTKIEGIDVTCRFNKPVASSTLLAAIETCLPGHRPRDPSGC